MFLTNYHLAVYIYFNDSKSKVESWLDSTVEQWHLSLQKYEVNICFYRHT